MKQAIDIGTRKKNLSIVLQELAKDVTNVMKAEAEMVVGVPRSTINDYLKGNVGNCPTADALVKLFRKRIIEANPTDIRA